MTHGKTDPAQRGFLFLNNYLYEYCSNTLQFYDGNDATPQAGGFVVIS